MDEEKIEYVRINYSTLAGKGVYEALNLVVDELEKAMKKHPEFPKFGDGQASVVMEEVGEWADAAKSGVWDHARCEAAHACAVLIRSMVSENGSAAPSQDTRIAEAMTALGEYSKDVNDGSCDEILMMRTLDVGVSALKLSGEVE